MDYFLPLNYDIKSSLYKRGLNGQHVNLIQNYIYPSHVEWRNVFQSSIDRFNSPKDTVLLYDTGKMPIDIDYEWVDRLPGLIDQDTNNIIYHNDINN